MVKKTKTKTISHKHIARPKIKDKDKTLKPARGKNTSLSRGTRTQMASDLSPETVQARESGTSLK